MSRVLTGLLVIGFLAAAAPADVTFNWAEVGGAPTGYTSYDLSVVVNSNISEVQMYIEADSPSTGDFYQNTGHTFDTYLTFPTDYSEIGEAINITGTERSSTFSDQLLDIAWGVDGGATGSGSGTHTVARVTVKNGLSGTWQVYANETGSPPIPGFSDSGTYPLVPSALPGDFNDDAVLDALDIDLLAADIVTPSGDPKWDVDGSGGDSDSDDMTYWVGTLAWGTGTYGAWSGGTYFGDANLDGRVNNIDLTVLAFHWLGSPWGWDGANFSAYNGDTIVNNVDLTMLAFNWLSGVSEPPGEPASVPEPSVIALLAVGMVAVICKRK